MALLITITNAGRAEMIAAENTGTEKVTITAVAFGTGQYTPSKAQTALQAEVKRVSSIGGQVVAADTIHVMALDESSAAYNVGEFGLISDKGTLIAVYSHLPAAGWIIQKAAPSTLLLATDIILESLDASVIQFGDIAFINPPATVDTPGVVQLEHSLTNPSNARALTAGMGKKLQDEKEPNIAAGTTAQYWRGNKAWRDFATDVRAAVLTGLSTASAAAIAASDSVLSAMGKLQAQISGLATSKLDANANAVSATKLATARTISVSGAAEGSVSFDGSSSVEVVTKTPRVDPANDPTSSFRADVFGAALDDKIKLLRPESSGHLNFPLYSPCLVWSTSDTHAFFSPSFNSPRIRVGAGFGAGIQWSKDLAFTDSDITGNAATATKLATARTIGGVAFDGTANINLPGVNQAGNQSTTGNAATATRLATARAINGVPFDGSANISIPVPQNTAGLSASAPSWWRCADTGLIIQTGRYNGIGTGSPLTVTFPTAFPNACTTVALYADNSSADHDLESQSRFNFVTRTSSNTSGCWVAYGY